MININSEIAQTLAWERQKLEVAMCQKLANVYDKDMTPFMTILGRMSVFKMKERLTGLPGKWERELVDKLAFMGIVYAPFKLIAICENMESQGAKPKWEGGSLSAVRKLLERAILLDDAYMLHPKYPWGVLTLGGIGRFYAEVSEEIYGMIRDKKPTWLAKAKFQDGKKVSDPKSLNPKKKTYEMVDVRSLPAWAKEAVLEEEGRVSWQKKLMDLQKPTGQLFLKGQPGGELEIVKSHILGQSGRDRLRYAWSSGKPVVHPKAKKNLRGFNLGKGYVKAFKDTLKSLEPPWTGAGRLRWQTFATDRISLLGDIFGLVRGATISGTTSDHLYTFWQLLHSVKEAAQDTTRKAILTRPVKKGAIEIYKKKDMESALSAITTDVGWSRIVGLMQLVPVIQMGIEMHHSVHEMASVLGLNDLLKYKIGYYESLMTHLKVAKSSMSSTYSDVSAGMAKTKLATVEAAVKRILSTCQKNATRGYFKTIDPTLVEVVDKAWGGCILEDTDAPKLKKTHATNASVNENLIKGLEKDIVQKRITNQGITEDYLNKKGYFQSITRKEMGNIAIKKNNNPGEKYAIISKKGNNILIKEQSVKKIASENAKLWSRYKNLYRG